MDLLFNFTTKIQLRRDDPNFRVLETERSTRHLDQGLAFDNLILESSHIAHAFTYNSHLTLTGESLVTPLLVASHFVQWGLSLTCLTVLLLGAASLSPPRQMVWVVSFRGGDHIF
jgi:hypothetical protein